MTKPAKPIFSDDVIALARDELRHHQRGDDFQCAIMKSHGRSFVLAHASRGVSEGRGRPGHAMFAIDENGRVYPTQAVDGLYSVVDEPDRYFFPEDWIEPPTK
jgi:hypothetical protein